MGGTDRALIISYDSAVPRAAVIEGVKRALESVPDPVYDQPIIVRAR
jgi:hypothetical protein